MNVRRLLVFLVPLALALTLAPPGWSKGRTTSTLPPSTSPVPVRPGDVVNSWALSPAQSQEFEHSSDRTSFSYDVAAGTHLTDQATLYNYSNVQLTFHVYGTDAFNDQAGGFSVLSGDKKPTDVGAWIHVPQAFTLPANSQVTFPVTIDVPLHATPGDHAGAILASSPVSGSGPDGKIVNVDRRTGTRMYIRVAGRLTPRLAVTKLSAAYHARLSPLGGHVTATYRIENIGNVRLAGTQRFHAGGLLGMLGKSTKPTAIPELLPGQAFTLRAELDGLPATILGSAGVSVEPAKFDGKRVDGDTRRSVTFAPPYSVLAFALVALLIARARRSYVGHAYEGLPRSS